jgi:hypothetical protein
MWLDVSVVDISVALSGNSNSRWVIGSLRRTESSYTGGETGGVIATYGVSGEPSSQFNRAGAGRERHDKAVSQPLF